MVLTGIDITWHSLLIIPLVAELFIFSLAVSFFLSALFVRFRDISYIWEVIMQAAFYATPILYPLSLIPHRAAKILMLNPMAQIIQDARHVLITPKTDNLYTLYGNSLIWAVPLGVTLIVVILASTYFRSRSKYFAEEV
jgi:ABC-2 type transport system permease protein